MIAARIAGIGSALALLAAAAAADEGFPVPRIPFSPRHYICHRAPAPPEIDGRRDEAAWQAAPWTEEFVDIEGALRPAPRHRTRAQMLWDDQCFYVAAELEEPDLWATITQRDAVIYQDNDFEVFIDPDGDSHEYYELEVNALNTVWDLLLIRPYRDGGPAVNAWDIAGLRTAVQCDGTLNDPRDRDRGWTVEIAIPWRVLAECSRGQAPPVHDDLWRVNFSRVQWQLTAAAGAYAKRRDAKTGRNLPEDNWVWSPQGLIAMHYPEMWGVVQFSTYAAGTPEAAATPARADPNQPRWWTLRQVYYAQKRAHDQRGRYLDDRLELGRLVRALDPVRAGRAEEVVLPVAAAVRLTPSGYEATLAAAEGTATLHIRDDGRTWRSVP